MLRVNPERLRSAAAEEAQLSGYLSSLGAGQSMAGAVSAMSGLQSAVACQFAGVAMDNFAGTLVEDVSSHAARLGMAADRYQQADAEFGRRLRRLAQ